MPGFPITISSMLYPKVGAERRRHGVAGMSCRSIVLIGLREMGESLVLVPFMRIDIGRHVWGGKWLSLHEIWERRSVKGQDRLPLETPQGVWLREDRSQGYGRRTARGARGASRRPKD